MAKGGFNSVMKAPRLEFVRKKLEGTRVVRKVMLDKKTRSLTYKEKTVPAGYLIYTPAGGVYHLSEEEMLKRNFGRRPKIINFDRVSDTESPAGRFKFAITMEERQEAWAALEKQIIDHCQSKVGPIRLGSYDMVDPSEKEVSDDAQAA